MGKLGFTMEELILRDRAKNEKQLQNNIVRLLGLHGVVAIRQRMDKKSNVVVGCPDILCAIHGTPCAFEAKMPGEKPTKDQYDIQEKMRLNGWRVFLVHDLHEVKNILEAIENHHPN